MRIYLLKRESDAFGVDGGETETDLRYRRRREQVRIDDINLRRRNNTDDFILDHIGRRYAKKGESGKGGRREAFNYYSKNRRRCNVHISKAPSDLQRKPCDMRCLCLLRWKQA